MLTRDEVILAYRLLLGREPESERVIQEKIANAPDLPTLRRTFIESAEFRYEVSQLFGEKPGWERLSASVMAPIHVEYLASPQQLRAMIAATARFWDEIGASAPYFSVLTNPEYLQPEARLDLDGFFSTGASDTEALLVTLARHGRHPAEFPILVELGCGVGRASIHLARHFAQVIGCDISLPHLRLARQAAEREGHRNLHFRQATAGDLMPAQEHHLWFSRIVLQHNPPPVIHHILDLAFARLAPGGMAVFQVPTYSLDYRFSITDYLEGRIGEGMEMHVLPQAAILALAEAHGCRLLELLEDDAAGRDGPFISNVFAFAKDMAPRG